MVPVPVQKVGKDSYVAVGTLLNVFLNFHYIFPDRSLAGDRSSINKCLRDAAGQSTVGHRGLFPKKTRAKALVPKLFGTTPPPPGGRV